MNMEICGVKFVPWNTPLSERLETLAAGFPVCIFLLYILGPCFSFYLIAYTRLWPIVALYLTWIYVIDRKTPEEGGRRCEWMRSWSVWEYYKNYFPLTLTKVNGVDLDPKRNYLFAAFPHGHLTTGASLVTISNTGFSEFYPNHKPHFMTLHTHFKMPIYRDIILALGCCSSSEKSLRFLLDNSSGGQIAVLIVGGVAEQMIAKPGTYQLVLKKRKGFVRLALESGSPLVPVFTFGENDIYTQPANPEGSWWRNVQEWTKKKISIYPSFGNGRGFFQYSYGLLPRKMPLNVVVGRPIEVAKVSNPTQEEIDQLHTTFIKELVNLYEENKGRYGNDSEKIELVIH